MKMPDAWLNTTTEVKASAQVTARISMSADVAGAGLCPDCKKPMEEAITNGIASYVCNKDRIAIPKPD